MTSTDASRANEFPEKIRIWDKVKGGLFLGSVTGMAMLFGFGATIALAKRKDPKMFMKGAMKGREIPESGVGLASRALMFGTAYSVAGVGLICFIFWKAVGAKDINDFRQIMGKNLPSLPKKESDGRSDFSSVRELINYVIEEDEKRK